MSSLDQTLQPLTGDRVLEEWKMGQVVPIYKKGSRSDPSNYRPVSLTSVTSKVLESLVRDALLEHFAMTGLLTDCQHGFRPGRSCATQLLCTLEDWTRLMEEGEPVDVAYLDFRRAFDLVPPLRLLQKLHDMGIRGRLLEWLRSFLTDRKQRVIHNGSASDWTPVGSGIPRARFWGLCSSSPLSTTYLAASRAPANSSPMMRRCTSERGLSSAVGTPEGLGRSGDLVSQVQVAIQPSEMHSTSLGQTKRADGVLHRGRYSEEDRGGEGPGSPGGPAAEIQGASSGRCRKSQPIETE